MFLSGNLDSNSQLSSVITTDTCRSDWYGTRSEQQGSGGKAHHDSASSGVWSPAAGRSARPGAPAPRRRSLSLHWPPAAPASSHPWLRLCTQMLAADARFLLEGYWFEKRKACMLQPQRQRASCARLHLSCLFKCKFGFFLIRAPLVKATHIAVAYRDSEGKIPIMCPRTAPVSPSLMQ